LTRRKKDETTWANMHPEARAQIADILRDVIRKGRTMDDSTETKRGTIKNITGAGSIITLHLEDAQGRVTRVNAENAPTVRALVGIFGSEIVRGHTLLVERVLGQEIGYDTDDLGLLAYVTE
jgi:hypothetical protein